MLRLMKWLMLALILITDAVWAASSVTIGGVTIVVPPPSGLQNAQPTAPQLAADASALVTKNSRFLMLFVPPDALREYVGGNKSVYLPRYAMLMLEGSIGSKVETRVLPDEFKRIQGDLEKRLGTLFTPEIEKKVNESQATKNAGAKLEISNKSRIIAKGVNYISNDFSSNVTSGGTVGKIYGVSTLVLIKDKLLTLNMYYNPPSQQDIKDAGNAAALWAKEITAAN